MPTFKFAVKTALQVVAVTYTSLLVSQLVSDLFDRVAGE